MAKLSRVLLKLFGSSGATSNFEQFGSTVAGSATFTKDVATIQALTAWLDGWQDAVYGTNKAPILEDMNALFYVLCYQLAYLFENGIPEYEATTNYFTGSIVRKTGTAELYKSLVDNNLGNALPSKTDNANWQYAIQKGILVYDSGFTYSVGDLVQKSGTSEIYKSLTNNNLGNALPNQTTTANWQFCADLANLTPPPAGVQKIKFGFIPLTITSTVTAVATAAKNPTSDFGFDADMTVYAFTILNHTQIGVSTAAAQAFSFNYEYKMSLSGSGVDASGKFINGGSPSSTYTATLNLNVTNNVGEGTCNVEGLAVFIGIK